MPEIEGPAASVRVAVRVRPFNDREKHRDETQSVTTSSKASEVILVRGTSARQQRQTYNFDSVFTTNSTQRDVFESVRPMVSGSTREGGITPPPWVSLSANSLRYALGGS